MTHRIEWRAGAKITGVAMMIAIVAGAAFTGLGVDPGILDECDGFSAVA